MSKRQPRFEICRDDDGYWARFRAANGRIVWVTETYTKRRSALFAIDSLLRFISPTNQVWLSTTQDSGGTRSEARMGVVGGSMYMTAERFEIRHLDER